MHAYVHPDADEGDAPPRATHALLPYGEALAFDLWLAWKDKGVMPHAGGYLDQPRQWQRLIRLMNSHYNPIFQRSMAERFPDSSARGEPDYGGGDDARSGWGAFVGG